jgi:hypothetical protein
MATAKASRLRLRLRGIVWLIWRILCKFGSVGGSVGKVGPIGRNIWLHWQIWLSRRLRQQIWLRGLHPSAKLAPFGALRANLAQSVDPSANLALWAPSAGKVGSVNSVCGSVGKFGSVGDSVSKVNSVGGSVSKFGTVGGSRSKPGSIRQQIWLELAAP